MSMVHVGQEERRDGTAFLKRKGHRTSHRMPPKFVPIADLDAYIKGLKREGFYNDLQIADIRMRHQTALDEQARAREERRRERTLRIEQKVIQRIAEVVNAPVELCVDNVWECQVKIKVRKDGTLKTVITFPFAEFDHWITHKENDKPPLALILKTFKTAGCSREVCEQIVTSGLF